MLALAFVGCKKTKDTFTSRTYHRTVSKFNPLFNGQQAMIQGEASLALSHRDDFSKILKVFKEGDEAAASGVKPTMDKAIEKAAKVVQEHSMMIRNEQKNAYIDDSYLLLGKARYYKREYMEALETFNYCVQQYPDSKNYEEARYWAARTETALGNYLSAKDKFEKMYRSEDVPKRLRGDVFAAYGQLEIDQKHYSVAAQLMQQASDKTKDKQKEVRWLFIVGQLQAASGQDYEASQTFKKVIKKGPPYDLLFQAQLNRARSYDVDLQDPEVVFDDLKAMLKDDKNYDNRDQIYYVMAEVAEKLEDEGMMEEYLKKSIRTSTTNNNQKALSYLKLAEMNFENRIYTVAAAYYDSTYSNLEKENARFEEVKLKKESLDELVNNLKIIELEDSLQNLASLGEKQRLKKIQDIIDKEREAEEEAKRKEEMQLNNPFANGESITANNQSSVSGGQWYFYNQNLRAVGVRDFTNRFGNRKLEDNWRRKDKETIAEFSDNSSEGDIAGKEGGEDAGAGDDGESKVQEYLAKVPLTEEQIAASDKKIIDAYINVGTIYKDNFKDLNAAETELKALLKRYSDFEMRGRVLYTLYRINVLADDPKDAEYYKNLIKKEYPDSEYAKLVDGEIVTGEQDASAALKYYTKTFNRYKEKEYKKTVSMADSGASAYSNTVQGPQFLMLKAYSLGRMGKKDQMVQTLTVVTAQYQNTDQAKEAQRVLNQIGSDEKAEEGTKEDTKAAAAEAEKSEAPESPYKESASEQHRYIVVVPNTKGLVSNLTVEISDFNQKFFKNNALKTRAIYLNPKEQMIMVSGIPDKKVGLQYMSNITQQKVLEKQLGPEPVKHFVISNTNFQVFYSEKDFEGYLEYYKKNYSK